MEEVEPFEKYSERYDSWYDRHQILYQTELNMLKKVKVKHPSIEIGCGSGRFTKPLNIELGLDLSQQLMKIAKRRGVDVIMADAHKLPFRKNSFNYVLLAFTLCFLRNIETSLEEIKRVLKEKGELIILFIPKDSWLGKKLVKRKNSPFYAVAKFYNYNDLLKLVIKYGFKLLEVWGGIENSNPKRIMPFWNKNFGVCLLRFQKTFSFESN